MLCTTDTQEMLCTSSHGRETADEIGELRNINLRIYGAPGKKYEHYKCQRVFSKITDLLETSSRAETFTPVFA
jgi:hypothetical protein